MWGKGWHEPHGMGVPAEIVLPIYQCHAQATAQRQASVWLIIEVSGNLGSGTDDHHFGGFDHRDNRQTLLELEPLCRGCADQRRDLMPPADVDDNLRHHRSVPN